MKFKELILQINMQGCTAGSLLVPYTPYLGSIYYWLNVGLLCCLSEIRRERENIYSQK